MWFPFLRRCRSKIAVYHLLCLLAAGVPPAAALERPPDVFWARSGGGPENVFGDAALAVAGDGQGGSYVTGMFSGRAQFGGREIVTPLLASDFFLVKYDPAGTPVWVKHGTSPEQGRGYGTALLGTADGGVLVLGESSPAGTIDGQNDEIDDENMGGCRECGGCSFVAKYDAQGNRLWFHFLRMPSGSAQQLAVDKSGNAYVAGSFHAYVSIEGQIAVRQSPFSQLTDEVFLAKFGPTGQLQWARQVSEAADFQGLNRPTGLVVDGEGSLYLAGIFSVPSGINSRATKFGPVTLTMGMDSFDPVQNEWSMLYIVKLAPTGSGIWGGQFSRSGNRFSGSVAVDGLGFPYLYLAGSPASALIRFDPNGQQSWKKEGLGEGIAPLACDAAGDTVLVGNYEGVGFQSLTGQTATGQGLGLVSFNLSGELRWARWMPSSGPDGGYVNPTVHGLAQDASDRWLIAGFFDDFVLLDGIHLQSPWPMPDRESFVARLEVPQIGAGTPKLTEAALLSDGRCRLSITATIGARLGIEACSDLKSWLSVGQVTAANGTATFVHEAAGNFVEHYYRVVLLLP